MANSEIYLSLQVQFLTALQTRDLAKAFDISQDIEKRWPGHPNVALFREVVEQKAKALEADKASANKREEEVDSDTDSESTDNKREEEVDSDTDSESTDSEADEETLKKNAAFEAEMSAKIAKWESQLATNDYDGMKKELEAVGLLRKC
eukprot:TRINITY_DN7923_c0_g1_i1.p1 TRINITY_DN7923_c0_g1~~TRINITY_DN7923_c0_g1_i1.p1  ORF type:complete len:159 (+),score=63.03 TRINITY_DN7923_c0_g1_i1:33-479(+)